MMFFLFPQDPVWWLGEAWERYNEFEEYRYYDKTLSLTAFVAEWENRLVAAVAAGCEYNDTVLAFKLLDRVQLAEEENRALLALVATAAATTRVGGGGGDEDVDMLALVKTQLAAQFKAVLWIRSCRHLFGPFILLLKIFAFRC
jgi:hypothetical protein